MAHEAVMIMTTVKDRDEAGRMAAHLLGARLAACVQEVAVSSHFNWDGEVNHEPEVLLLVKTAADRAEAAVQAISDRHGYEVPEIVVTPIIGGLGAYLQWVRDETREFGRPGGT